jgi:hypothetical protein
MHLFASNNMKPPVSGSPANRNLSGVTHLGAPAVGFSLVVKRSSRPCTTMEIPFPTSMVVVEDQVLYVFFFRSCSPNQSRSFSHGRCDEYCPCNIWPDCYIFDNGDSYSWLARNIDKAVRLLFPGILVRVRLPMVIDYFNGCARARSLALRLKLKKRRTTVGIYKFMVRYLCHYLLPAFRKYKIVSWKKKSLKISKISSFSLRLYFVIARDSLYISTMYCLLL